jgi:hypothetical protein
LKQRRHHLRHRLQPAATSVAPVELVREDFQRLIASVSLRTTQLVEDMILMQSIEGHAHEGHGAFGGRRFVNTTIQDTVLALGRDPKAIAAQRQDLIDEIVDWTTRAVQGLAGNLLVSEEGDCLLDIGLFRQVEVDPTAVLKGLYLGGLRDNSQVRIEVEKRYGLSIGGGECALVDVAVMEGMGLDAEQLAHGEWQDRMEEFRQRGMIVEFTGDESRRLRYLYIRHRKGGGTSDDAAILAAGKLFGPSAALGAFLADAVDTFEKYVPLACYADQDDDLALWIEKHVPDIDPGREDLYKMTYLCAVPQGEQANVPDSSLRWMLTIDRKCDQTALESHLAYLQNRPYAPMLLAFERIQNRELYEWFTARYDALMK